MRRCLIGDIIAAAAALTFADLPQMQVSGARLIAQADAAHRYTKRYGRPHPLWGNGSLMARAMAEPVVITPNFSCPRYLGAFQAIAIALCAFRACAMQHTLRLAPVNTPAHVLKCP